MLWTWTIEMSPPLKCRWTRVQQAQECGTIASSGFNPVKLQQVHVSYCICQSYEKLSLGLKKKSKKTSSAPLESNPSKQRD